MAAIKRLFFRLKSQQWPVSSTQQRWLCTYYRICFLSFLRLLLVLPYTCCFSSFSYIFYIVQRLRTIAIEEKDTTNDCCAIATITVVYTIKYLQRVHTTQYQNITAALCICACDSRPMHANTRKNQILSFIPDFVPSVFPRNQFTSPSNR